MKSFGLILLLAASLVNTAVGRSNLYTGWSKKFDNEPYEDLTAQVGDSITFIWPTTDIANIFIHPTNDCTQTGRIPIGNQSPTEYIFKPEDAEPGGKQIFFANDVSDHCENYGMSMTVIVYPADEDDDDSNVDLTSDPTANPTNPPTFPPTLAPTPLPTALPTPLPSPLPTPIPTVASTFSPTVKPTTKPVPSLTENPTAGGVTEVTVRGLQMTLSGIDSFSDETKIEWSSKTEDQCTDFYEGDIVGSTFKTSITVTNFFLTSNSKRSMRGLQTNSVIVTYNQEVSYANTGRARITDEYLAKAPFSTEGKLDRFVTILQNSNDAVLKTVTGVSPVTFADDLVPTVAPTSAPRPVIDGPTLSMAAIIGIACGAGALVIIALLFWFYCGSSKGKELEMEDEDPPPNVSIKPDDVSTLAAPEAGNVAEQSLEGTVDYDYAKAYQDKDHSVSYAGGTLGSKTEDYSFPVNAGATGAALGPYDDADFAKAKFKEEILHIFAPAGKLGVVIDTPDDGAPLVHAVKDSSVVFDKVKVGDKLVAVDDEDVRTLTAIKVSKLISRKSANPSRKLTVLRRTQIEH